jgi:hypothetical protein
MLSRTTRTTCQRACLAHDGGYTDMLKAPETLSSPGRLVALYCGWLVANSHPGVPLWQLLAARFNLVNNPG